MLEKDWSAMPNFAMKTCAFVMVNISIANSNVSISQLKFFTHLLGYLHICMYVPTVRRKCRSTYNYRHDRQHLRRYRIVIIVVKKASMMSTISIKRRKQTTSPNPCVSTKWYNWMLKILAWVRIICVLRLGNSNQPALRHNTDRSVGTLRAFNWILKFFAWVRTICVLTEYWKYMREYE